MKRCPVWRRNYTDGTLNFCLEDGSVLSVPPNLEATIVSQLPPPIYAAMRSPSTPAPRETQPRKRTLVYLLVVLLVAGGASLMK
jgi:hypothetical protein